jgi:hypothetical protein
MQPPIPIQFLTPATNAKQRERQELLDPCGMSGITVTRATYVPCAAFHKVQSFTTFVTRRAVR